MNNRLDRQVDPERDHILGPENAPITLVEYGSYDCPHCRAAGDRITEIRSRFGDRLRYVFRHRPLTGSERARIAAELVELATTDEQFWDAHVALMTRSTALTEQDLDGVTSGLMDRDPLQQAEAASAARLRVDQDLASATASGVRMTPTFFINGLRYDGPWDESSFEDALLGSFGHRVRIVALSFASWAPSAGLLLLVATIAAILLTNSSLGPEFVGLWEMEAGIVVGGTSFEMSLLQWVNDALLTIFFLVVGLEIKREFTVGHLATRRSAALPIAAAIGGMAVPTMLYLLLARGGPWVHGWGVPMATDTAFAIALIAMMGERVPIQLRIALTAAAIIDDIGAIIVVAIFYSGHIDVAALGVGLVVVAALALLNRGAVYHVTPYLLLGVALWVCVHAGGLHATLAGVVLAAFIPTRPPPNYRTSSVQAESILAAEAQHTGEQYRRGPSKPALDALDAIHNRLESPADRLLRNMGPRSSYLVLPIFALANAGVLLDTGLLDQHGALIAAIGSGLVIGKPLGFVGAAWIAVRWKIADKPNEYSWRQLAGAGALAGIGFTMSLFIAGQAFPMASDFAAAKIAVFAASGVSALTGVILLWRKRVPSPS